ncbi:GNAT family N-acetyltransferase [Bacillus sp. FJAT-49736]|uniref:GNAT family N-acetyltransferase n=1 Tax=Bacillus sp. FJAT-49736 TaxID=2833582 RepID=UPI001BC9B317|nr:GNAT family N-acetyltransferase [Bacillus sp. FJAT-49736]MBS4172706.1 GNAT family N-acetyltransferase [Bacillus sp. FJAT-49736]
MGFVEKRYFKNKNGNTFVVRTALPKEAKKILMFNQEIIREAPYLVTTAEEFQLTIDQERRLLKEMMDDNGKLAIIAEYQDCIIGFLDFHNGPKKRLMHQGAFGMSVGEKHRNQGVGNALLTVLLDWTKENPLIEKVCLEVVANNKNAISLYEKYGFYKEGHKCKAIKVDDKTYYDLISMALLMN